jgi:hypothetical protein
MATIPDRDTDFDQFATAALAYITANLAHFGLVAGDMVQINGSKGTWDFQYPANLLTQTQAQAARASKDSARYFKPTGLEPLLRALLNRLAAYPATTDADRATLNIPIPGETAGDPAPGPPSRPVATIDTSERLTHTLRWRDEATGKRAKPAGVKEAEIRSAMTAQGVVAPALTAFVFLARDSETPYRKEFDPVDSGKTSHYILRWIFDDGAEGSWSETVSATVVG